MFRTMRVGQAEGEDRRGEDEVAAEVRDVEDEEDRVGLRDARHPAHQDVVGDLLVLGARREAVDAGEVDDVELGRVLDLQLAEVLLDGDAGEVRDLLAEPGEAVEEGGLAGVGRADDRHDARPGRARGRARRRPRGPGGRPGRSRRARGVLPRGPDGGGGGPRSRSGGRSRCRRRGRRAGRRPGARNEAATRLPGRKPSSMRRWVTSAGRSIRSRIASSPSGDRGVWRGVVCAACSGPARGETGSQPTGRMLSPRAARQAGGARGCAGGGRSAAGPAARPRGRLTSRRRERPGRLGALDRCRGARRRR